MFARNMFPVQNNGNSLDVMTGTSADVGIGNPGNLNDQTIPATSNDMKHDQQKISKPRGVGNEGSHNSKNNNNMMKRGGKPSCIWDLGTVMDLDVIVSDSPNVPDGWPSLTTSVASSEMKSNHGANKNTNDSADAAGVNPRRTKVKLPSADGTKSSSNNGRNDHSGSKSKETILASWHQEGLVLGGAFNGVKPQSVSILSTLFPSDSNQEMNYRNGTLTIPLTEAVWNNQTHVYAYVKLQRRRRYTNDGGNYKKRKVRNDDVLVKRMVLTRHRKRKKLRDEKSLLDTAKNNSTSAATTSVETEVNSVLTAAALNKTHDQILLYIKPSLTLQLVDMGPVDFPSRDSIPKQFSDHMDWYDGENDEGFGSIGGMRELYYPILHGSEFWITYSSLKEVNGTMKESQLDVIFEPVSMWKWQLQSQMEESWKRQEAFTGEEDHSNDMLRTMLLETNPYLLAVTGIVSMLHTVFDILAFKNDISFFKNKKSMEGLSLRSMIVNCFFSLVILLYLADNDTNFMVLVSNGVGLVIEIWKISKAITVKFEGGKIEWVEAQSYKKSRTKEYDEIATSHLLFVTMPLVAGYGMYSLYFQKHKGWYSWILNTLVGFIYMFGFVMMTPQLFINYKLQSVAHLNWRTMTYKSINTFIDDLFAFVIKMPIMHRLACLRDDVIFFIFCYQRYKYKTDYTRVNEFGQCSEPTEEMLAESEIETIGSENAVQARNVEGDTVRVRRGARERRK